MGRIAAEALGRGKRALRRVGFVAALLGVRHGEGKLAGAVGCSVSLEKDHVRAGTEQAYLERRVQRFSLLSIGSNACQSEG